MSDLNEIGQNDGWICWLCDKSVDPDASVNSDLGPSTDSYWIAKGNKGAAERLAHRQCNTMKGKIAPVVQWPKDLIVGDPAPIIESVERLIKKGGREAIARCPAESDAKAVEAWLLDRLTRLSPNTKFNLEVSPGGGQYLLKLSLA
jgi:hypothetical protein